MLVNSVANFCRLCFGLILALVNIWLHTGSFWLLNLLFWVLVFGCLVWYYVVHSFSGDFGCFACFLFECIVVAGSVRSVGFDLICGLLLLTCMVVCWFFDFLSLF